MSEQSASPKPAPDALREALQRVVMTIGNLEPDKVESDELLSSLLDVEKRCRHILRSAVMVELSSATSLDWASGRDASLAEAMFGISSSSTGAAELVYTVTDEQWSRALSTAYSCIQAPSISLADFDNAMQHAFGMLSLKVATPPVKGDREAIAKWLWEYLYSSKGFGFWADVSEETRDMWRTVASAFMVFLSLPIQLK